MRVDSDSEWIFQTLRQALSALPARPLDEPYRREAGIVVPIFLRDGRPSVLLTRRTEEVATHKGQISFPGGSRHPQDPDLCATALREMEEELGIPASSVELLGQLQEYRSVTDFLVRPFVGRLPDDVVCRPCAREVAYVLEVPLDFFLNTRPEVREVQRQDRVMEVYSYHFGGEKIWGLTARIVYDVVQHLNE